jgi:hypothetical protein
VRPYSITIVLLRYGVTGLLPATYGQIYGLRHTAQTYGRRTSCSVGEGEARVCVHQTAVVLWLLAVRQAGRQAGRQATATAKDMVRVFVR